MSDTTSVPVLQRVTVNYDEHEDRLQLAAEDANGQVIVLWLTQRLANRLVGALVAGLSKTTENLQDAGARSTVQAWEQSAAYAQHSAMAPVQSSEPVTRGLIRSVDIAQTDQHYQLIFRWPDDNAVAMPLDSTALRQWLGIIYGRYRQAQWVCEGIWPAWIAAEQSPDETRPAAQSLH